MRDFLSLVVLTVLFVALFLLILGVFFFLLCLLYLIIYIFILAFIFATYIIEYMSYFLLKSYEKILLKELKSKRGKISLPHENRGGF